MSQVSVGVVLQPRPVAIILKRLNAADRHESKISCAGWTERDVHILVSVGFQMVGVP